MAPGLWPAQAPVDDPADRAGARHPVLPADGEHRCRPGAVRRDVHRGAVAGAVGGQPRHRALGGVAAGGAVGADRSEEHTSELQSLMRISYAVFCLKKKKTPQSLTQDLTY